MRENRWCVRAPPSLVVTREQERGSGERRTAPEYGRWSAGGGAQLDLGGPPGVPGAATGAASHAGVSADWRGANGRCAEMPCARLKRR
ncbi:hypothetical protein NDU88_001853 [Pleurodeles waltl]|uniref:Uncharacterized protein n=1 Tax=Pleurodeles waltl TaxID=8319 RepID=A0AAV7MM37_PLEWA|nr:hypothetical protein NDU88_001853 [Pleurodeles waltl]